MGEIENQVPEEAKEFVAPTTDSEEKEGFVDPEAEAYHQGVGEEIGKVRQEQRYLGNRLEKDIKPFDDQLSKNDRLYGDLLERQKMASPEESKAIQDSIESLFAQNRELRRLRDSTAHDSDFRKKQSLEYELRNQNTTALEGDSEWHGGSVRK